MRLILLATPFNNWDKDETPAGFAVDRNVPLLAMGAGEMYFMRREDTAPVTAPSAFSPTS